VADDVETPEETTTAGALSTIASGAAWVFGGRIAKLTLLFVAQILMARLLGSTGYGGVVLATMVISVGAIVGNLGVPEGIVRKLPEYEDDITEARGVIQSGLALAVAGGLAVGGVVFVAAPYIAVHIFDDPGLTLLFRIAAVGIPCTVLMEYGVSTAKAARDAKPHVAIRQILYPLGAFVFISVLVVLGFGSVGAVVGEVAALGVAAVGGLYLARRALAFEFRGPARSNYREMLTFSLPLVFAGSMSFLINNTDTFLIGTYLTSSAVGVYAAVFQLQQLGMVFFFPATFLLPPLITRFQNEEKLGEGRRTYQVVTKWMTLSTLPLFVLLVVFPEVTIAASFGPDYTGGALVLQLLAIPIFITVLLGANDATLIALGHSRIQMYVNTTAAALNIVLNILFIPWFGIAGAAVASAAAYISRDLVYTVVLYHWHRFQPFSRSMLRPLAVVGLLLGPGWFAVDQLLTPTIVSVAFVGLVSLAVYGLLLLNLDVIDEEDFELLADLEQSVGVDLDPVRKLARSVQLPS